MKAIRAASIFMILICGCSSKYPMIGDFGGKQYELINQSGKKILFPDYVKGKILVMNYIFTNCPDLCPLNTNNMRLIKEKLDKEKIRNVQFVSLSFDPENDTPDVLSRFAEARNLDLENWDFLTGDKKVTDALIGQVGVVAVPGDSVITKEGKKIYYYIHTDRISLIDTAGRIRKNYKGSEIDIDEIKNDIMQLQ
jgi:protein SCO1